MSVQRLGFEKGQVSEFVPSEAEVGGTYAWHYSMRRAVWRAYSCDTWYESHFGGLMLYEARAEHCYEVEAYGTVDDIKRVASKLPEFRRFLNGEIPDMPEMTNCKLTHSITESPERP